MADHERDLDCQEAVISRGALARLAAAATLVASPCAALADARLHVEATASQLLHIADAAAARGEQQVALSAYAALMNDPSPEVRTEARFRLGLLEAKRGNLSRAALLLREVVDAAPSAARPRLELARILDRMGDKDGAWRQLRAVQASGLPAAVSRMVDRYSEGLRAQRPFGGSFEVALAPDSNINHATRLDRLGTVLGEFDINQDSKARSGTGVALRGHAYRRFRVSSDAQLLARVSGLADLYGKSSFNDIAGDVAIGPELQLGRSRINLEVGATQRWFGPQRFMRSLRLAASVVRPIGRRTQLRLSGAAALVDNQRNDLQDGRTYTGEIGIERALTPTMGVAATASLAREALKDPGYSTIGCRLGLLGWKDLGQITLTAGAEFGQLHADARFTLFLHRREDRYSRLTVGATFRRLSVGGFAPVARLVIERNRSSIAFYDFQRKRTEIGIERAF